VHIPFEQLPPSPQSPSLASAAPFLAPSAAFWRQLKIPYNGVSIRRGCDAAITRHPVDPSPSSAPRTGHEPGGQVKGTGFREMVRWTEKRFGRETLRRAYDRMRPEDQAVLDPDAPLLGVVATHWYPIRISAVITDTSLDGLSDTERRTHIRESARYTMDRTLKGVQRMLFQVMMTPERAARHMQKIWRLNYDSGVVRWEVIGPQHIEASIRDWPGHYADSCTMLQENETYFLELIGCKNVQSVRTGCVDSGADACSSTITWDP
jgi:hypothetical protein